MARKSGGKFEGSELSRGHGREKFQTAAEKDAANVMGSETGEDVVRKERKELYREIPDFIKNTSPWREYYQEHPDTPDPSVRWEKARDIHYDALETYSRSYPPKYILDAEGPVQDSEFENVSLHISSFTGFHNKPMHAVLNYAKGSYAEMFFPGLDYLIWLSENPDNVPEVLKAPHLFYVPGFLLRLPDGKWHTVYGEWNVSKNTWEVNVSSVEISGMDWRSGARMIFFEKTPKTT